MKLFLLFAVFVPVFISAQVMVIKPSSSNANTGVVIIVGDGNNHIQSQSSYAPVFSWLTRSAGTPCKDWEQEADKVFFAPVDKFRFSQKLFRQEMVNQLKEELKNYPREEYFYKWCATADLEVGVYDNLSKAQRASKLDELNSQHTFSWFRLSQIVDEFGSDAERDRLVEKAEQRGIYLYIVPKPEQKIILPEAEEVDLSGLATKQALTDSMRGIRNLLSSQPVLPEWISFGVGSIVWAAENNQNMLTPMALVDLNLSQYWRLSLAGGFTPWEIKDDFENRREGLLSGTVGYQVVDFAQVFGGVFAGWEIASSNNEYLLQALGGQAGVKFSVWKFDLSLAYAPAEVRDYLNKKDLVHGVMVGISFNF